MIGVVIGGAAAAALVSAALTWAVRAWGRRAALLDSPGATGHIKTTVRRVPNIGGAAVFWTIALATLAGVAAAWFGGEALPAWAAGHAEGVRSTTPGVLGVLAIAAVLHVMGLADDRRALGPGVKLVVMLAAGVLAVWALDARLLELLDSFGPAGVIASWVLTVLWIVAVTNALNFLDNMDGVAGGVTVVSGSLFAAAACAREQWFVAAALAVVVGAAAGFLVFNAPGPRRRATIFLGDGGSLVLGFLLACLTVRATYYGPTPTGDETGWSPWAVLMPLCVLAVPLYDLVVVSAIRISQGRSPLVGDQQHVTHRLRRLGLSDARVFWVVCGMCLVTGISGLLLSVLDGRRAWLAGGQVLAVLGLLALFERGVARGRSRAVKEGGSDAT